VNADGSGLKRLDDLSDWPDMPPWDDGEVPSPDGGKVAVLGNPLQINDAQGGNQVSVDGVHSGQASWSADGKTLVFATCPLTSEGASTIYLVAADGTGLRQLTDGSSRDCQPVFSPDGQSVTFVRVRDKVEQVVALDLGTLEERVLFSIDVTYGYDGDWPAWSPDESLIALSIQGMGIYVVKTDGSGAQQVVTTDWFGGQFVGLRWQSNSRLYFVSAAIGGD
jgi:TolB protein